MARLLREHGADPSAKDYLGYTARKMVEHGSETPEETKAQLRALLDPSSTPLMWACMVGDVATARLLLERGAPVDASTEGGTTALILACQNGHVEAARLLLEKGAAVDAQREDGATALMLACQDGHVAAARLLLEKGADRTLCDMGSDTALEFVDLGEHVPEETKAELRALLGPRATKGKATGKKRREGKQRAKKK